MNGTSNNATKKILGFDYQKLLALESCLNGKENEIIWIEYYGDIAHNGTSKEIKHHITDSYLNDAHMDFWKTLYNLVVDKEQLSIFDRFELITTSKIKTSSIFFEWNDLDATTKLLKLKTVPSNKSISQFHNRVMEESNNEILPILDKLVIISSQPNIENKLNELKSHPALLFIPTMYIESFIEKILGYISIKAIDNSNMWHIEWNDFKREMVGYAKPFLKDDFPFPSISKREVENKKTLQYYFITELDQIKLDLNLLNTAILDYLRSEKSLLQLLKLHSSLADNLEDFDEDLENDLALLKLKHASSLTNHQIKAIEKLELSKTMYADALLMKNKKIRGVQEIDGYYQKGRIHSRVEQRKFSWIFIEDNK
ncbi:hypothetical protein [Dickeya dadantii]|uniref:hypothetical protein n=1 Tax=Dickeya dadantii TaxID=204038 RepID=UPI001C0B849A|nr:hypothetical protein [Dickeya dadantii]QWT41736.1 hypothetical protein KNV89_04270 [Dickeya dadantii]